jgi:hypothetical protein
MCWLVAAAALSLAAPLRADHDSDKKDKKDSALPRVLQDTYWRWAYGVSNIVLPKDENTNAVLNGIALLPLPNAPGDGTPGSIDITLRGGQSFFLPLFGLLGTSYTNGSAPDPLVDLSIFKTLAIRFTIDGKTVIDSKNVLDYYSQSTFVPPIPLNSGGIDSVIYFQGIGFLGEPLSPGKHVLKLDVKNTKPAFGVIVEYHNTFNITVSPTVVPPTEEFKGKSYAEWTAKWWQWFLEFPVDRPNDPHPSTDDPKFNVRDGQSGDVWFLASPFGTITRNITVPDNKGSCFQL